jgi:hypothetical protein
VRLVNLLRALLAPAFGAVEALHRIAEHLEVLAAVGVARYRAEARPAFWYCYCARDATTGAPVGTMVADEKCHRCGAKSPLQREGGRFVA